MSAGASFMHEKALAVGICEGRAQGGGGTRWSMTNERARASRWLRTHGMCLRGRGEEPPERGWERNCTRRWEKCVVSVGDEVRERLERLTTAACARAQEMAAHVPAEQVSGAAQPRAPGVLVVRACASRRRGDAPLVTIKNAAQQPLRGTNNAQTQG